MITFKELRISKDNKLVVNADIEMVFSRVLKYKAVVYVNNQNSLSAYPDYNNLLCSKETSISTSPFDNPDEPSLVNVNFELDINEFKGGNPSDLFIVTIGVTESLRAMTIEKATAVTFDVNMLYVMSLNYLKELGTACKIPKEFINFILSYKMLKSAIKTGHIEIAKDMFNKMFNKGKKITNKCCCNGSCSI